MYDLKFNVSGLNPSDVLNRGDLSGSISFSDSTEQIIPLR